MGGGVFGVGEYSAMNKPESSPHRWRTRMSNDSGVGKGPTGEVGWAGISLGGALVGRAVTSRRSQ